MLLRISFKPKQSVYDLQKYTCVHYNRKLYYLYNKFCYKFELAQFGNILIYKRKENLLVCYQSFFYFISKFCNIQNIFV